MNGPTARLNLSNVVAACIIAAGLVTAALIVAHRPVITTTVPAGTMPTGAASANLMGMPPIAQEAVAERFRSQVLGTPNLHTLVYKGVTYTLTDIKLEHVIYSAKDDSFTIPFDWVWQPAMIADGPEGGVAELTNDGYRQYHDSVGPYVYVEGGHQLIDPAKVIDVTVK